MVSDHTHRGIYSIPSTPFLPDGQVDWDGFARVVHFCIECGAHGLVYPVNASEFTTLSDSERKQLSQALIRENRGRVPVILNVAAGSKEAAAEFALHAKDIGADGLIAMPPYARKRELSEPAIFEYYQAISDTGQMPVFVQNDRAPVGTQMSINFVLRLCREIEWVEYVKEETIPSTVKMSHLLDGKVESCKGYFGGSGARYLVEEYLRGSSGNMPGCHLTDVVVSMWNAVESGDADRADEIFEAMGPMFFFQDQMPIVYKEVLKRRGVIESAVRRNALGDLDDIGSRYLDRILSRLASVMTWSSDG